MCIQPITSNTISEDASIQWQLLETALCEFLNPPILSQTDANLRIHSLPDRIFHAQETHRIDTSGNPGICITSWTSLIRAETITAGGARTLHCAHENMVERYARSTNRPCSRRCAMTATSRLTWCQPLRIRLVFGLHCIVGGVQWRLVLQWHHHFYRAHIDPTSWNLISFLSCYCLTTLSTVETLKLVGVVAPCLLLVVYRGYAELALQSHISMSETTRHYVLETRDIT